ncbi:DUF6348 family protein [Soonwooa sp.]|uniref:DUF6348 family protein n=1 Tax=Soonwooa sp. TaxID=1938592 RepID=UPI00260B5205|nr:DUF6348 family protein [Soonwooa sp.]
MGLFNFFKKDKGTPIEKEKTQISDNEYLTNRLQQRIAELGYQVEKHPQYSTSLVINDDLEIATAIIENPDYHPSILHLLVITIHKTYFPDGIKENIVGIGENLETKVESVLNNYLNTTFEPIIESFSDTHDPDLDFYHDNVLWHPKLGRLFKQGSSDQDLEENDLYNLVKDKVTPQMSSDKKFHWLKLYISKREDGSIIGECLFDNELSDNIFAKLEVFAETWKVDGTFAGFKQFIMFRKCDKYD